MSTWVVVVEWALGKGDKAGIDSDRLRALLEALSDLDPTALHQPDRYAVQVRVEADCPAAAISQVLERHGHAVGHVSLGGQLVRLELLTPEELESELEHFANSPEGRSALDLLTGLGGDPVFEAESALDLITGPEDARRVVSRMVHQLGGGVVAGRLEDEWMLPVDISFGASDPRVPIAEPWSIARLRLEQELPRIVEKARLILLELSAGALGNAGDTVGLHACLNDISQPGAYLDVLCESAAEHRVITDQLAAAEQAARIGVWEWDLAANTTWWSDELFRIHGREAGQETPSFDDYLLGVHPDDRALIVETTRRAIASGESYSFDHRFTRPDGTMRIIHARADVLLGATGTAVRLTGTAQDVTDLVVTTLAVRDSERRLAEAHSALSLGSWEWDIAADRVTWSDELYDMFGVDPATFVATYRGYLDHVHPDDRALVQSSIDEAFRSRAEFVVDHRVVRADGSVTWVHGRGQVETGADGVPVRLFGIAADITTWVAEGRRRQVRP